MIYLLFIFPLQFVHFNFVQQLLRVHFTNAIIVYKLYALFDVYLIEMPDILWMFMYSTILILDARVNIIYIIISNVLSLIISFIIQITTKVKMTSIGGGWDSLLGQEWTNTFDPVNI